jgi:hypothetical protein
MSGFGVVARFCESIDIREAGLAREIIMPFAFKVNGRPVDVDAPKDTPLLWILREYLKMGFLMLGLSPRNVAMRGRGRFLG